MPGMLNWLLRLVPTNPICVRIIASGSRRWRDMVIRALYLGIMIALMLVVQLANIGIGTFSMRDMASGGASIFQGTSYVQVVLICLLAPIFMAGSIIQESNPRTWDILLTTPLNSAQIVLGNIFGRLFFIMSLLLASLPIFLFLQIFGGVPTQTILESYAIAICSAFLVGSIAVTLSVTRVVGKRSVFVFYALIVFYLAGTYLLDARLGSRITTSTGMIAQSTTWLTALNPFLAIEALLQPNSYRIPEIWDSGWLHQQWMTHPVRTFNVLCCLISVLLIMYSTIRVRLLVLPSMSIDWLQRMFNLTPSGSISRVPRTVGQNPIAWRESHLRRNLASICSRWGFFAVGILLLFLVVAQYMMSDGLLSDMRTLRVMLTVLLMTETIIVVLTAVNLSATAVSKEREDGSLDLILTTPIQPAAYLAGKHLGLLRYLMPMIALPVLSMLLLSGYMYCGGFGSSVTTEQIMPNGIVLTEPLFLSALGISFTIVFIPFIIFCVMVGLHWSIRSKGTIGSIAASLILLFSLFFLLGLCLIPATGELPILGVLLVNLNPGNMLLVIADPIGWLEESWEKDPNGGTIQTVLLVGGVISGGIYLALAWAMHKTMSRTFMITVRRLSGTS